ncbi:MAG: arginase family protein [Candidatus Rokuibacteriota bacterium]
MTRPFQPIDGFKSPRFAQIPTFMRLPRHRTPGDLGVAVVGIPYDGGTSYRAGARFGPREIRSQSAMIRPWNPVLKVSPFAQYDGPGQVTALLAANLIFEFVSLVALNR